MKQSFKHKKRNYSSSSSSSSRSSSSSKSRERNRQKHKQNKHKSKKQKSQRYRSRSRSNQRKQKKSNKKEVERENKRQKQTEKYERNQNNVKQQQHYQQKNIEKNQVQADDKQMRDIKDETKNEEINRIAEQQIQKQLPCFEASGILLQFYNSRQGVSLRFHQPSQARQPDLQWRIYVFKGQQVLKPIVLTKSAYLVGKDQRVVDILAQNPSISRQHCVIQFRLIQKRKTQGQFEQFIKPYVMDLQSTNGTFLNDQKIQSGRYYQLLHKDVLKFGFSDREYVMVKWQENGQGQQ